MVGMGSGQVPGEKSVQSHVFDVVSPIGEVTVQQQAMAPRLDTLAGKTICSVQNGSFKSWVMGPVYEKLLAGKYPTARIIPNTEMPVATKAPPPGQTDDRTEALIAALRERSCDAVIVGNGG